MDLYYNIVKFLIFTAKMTLWKISERIPGRDTHNSELILYRVIKYHYLPLLCKRIKFFSDFPSLYINNLDLPMILTKIKKFLHMTS